MTTRRITEFIEAAKTACLATALAAAVSTRGSDWPQYLGANHDGISTDRITDSWPTNGPSQLWRISLNGGYSTFTGSQGKVYTLTGRKVTYGTKNQHFCLALNVDTGAETWRTLISEDDDSDEPNSTPTLGGNSVYVLSNDLALLCLDAETGTILWRKDLIKEFSGKKPSYGNGASPTVEGDSVFVNSGSRFEGNLLAFKRADGALVWKKAGGALGYATPIAATILGVRQVIFHTTSELISVVPETGDELWRFKLINTSGDQAVTPTVFEDIVLLGEYPGGVALRFSTSAGKFITKQIWSPRYWDPYSAPVIYKGHAYGIAENSFSCVDLQTGKATWSRVSAQDSSIRYSTSGLGGVIVVDDRILILTSGNYLILAESSSTSYNELACYKALESRRCYNHPIVFNGRVYARHNSEGVCLDIAKKEPSAIVFGAAQRNADGGIQVPICDGTGNCLPTERVARMNIVSSTNLNVPLPSWQTFTDWTLLTNGMLRLPNPDHAPQRFFRGFEKQ